MYLGYQQMYHVTDGNREMSLQKWRAFIDTNIFLDLYRANNETSLELLQRICASPSKYITTDQVEMEFLSNRQTVISASLSQINSTYPNVAIPSFLKSSKHSSDLTENRQAFEKVVKSVRIEVEKLLSEPAANDPVYKLALQFFSNADSNIGRKHPEKGQDIYERADRRYRSGCPPRKSSDTSMGDAINWEWIKFASQKLRCNVVIVSRDGDFGFHGKKTSFVNDYLAKELNSQMGKREIQLTQRISVALELLELQVSLGEAKAELKEIVDRVKTRKALADGTTGGQSRLAELLLLLSQTPFPPPPAEYMLPSPAYELPPIQYKRPSLDSQIDNDLESK